MVVSIRVEKLNAKLPNSKVTVKSGGKSFQHAMFDTNAIGFEPRNWEHPVVARCLTEDLVFVDVESDVKIRVGYIGDENLRPRVNHLPQFARIALDIHGKNRKRKNVGSMAGFGYHVYNGLLQYCSSKNLSETNECISCVGRVMNMVWHGNVDYEQMLECQGTAFNRGGHARTNYQIPMCYQVSENLGNAPHCDRDHTYSFAVWIT